MARTHIGKYEMQFKVNVPIYFKICINIVFMAQQRRWVVKNYSCIFSGAE